MNKKKVFGRKIDLTLVLLGVMTFSVQQAMARMLTFNFAGWGEYWSYQGNNNSYWMPVEGAETDYGVYQSADTTSPTVVLESKQTFEAVVTVFVDYYVPDGQPSLWRSSYIRVGTAAYGEMVNYEEPALAATFEEPTGRVIIRPVYYGGVEAHAGLLLGIRSIAIEQSLPDLAFEETSVTAVLGEDFEGPELNGPVYNPVWKSSNQEVAVITGDNKVIPVGVGTTTISITDGAGQTASYNLTVTETESGEGTYDPVTIHVETPGTLQELMIDVEQMRVKKLVVTGSINSDDIVYIKSGTGRMASLESIDLSGVTHVEPGTQPYFSTGSGGGLSMQSSVGYYLAEKDSVYSWTDGVFKSHTEIYTTRMEYLFAYQNNLKEVVLPSFMTVLGQYMLKETSIVRMTLPENVTEIEQEVFSNCASLIYVDGLEHVSRIGFSAFQNCEKLMGNSTDKILCLGQVDTIESGTFYGCGNLVGIQFSPTLRYIGNDAFYSCRHLVSLDFPASLKAIDDRAFYRCTTLQRVTFAEGVETIGHRAFAYCSSLGSVSVPASVLRLYATTFEDTPLLNSLTPDNGIGYLGTLAITAQAGQTALTFREGTTYIVENFQNKSTGVTSVSLPSTLKRIGAEALYKTACRTIVLPEGLVELGRKALSPHLEELTLPNALKLLDSQELNQLSTLTLPEGLERISAIDARNLLRLNYNVRRLLGAAEEIDPETGDPDDYSYRLYAPALEKVVIGPKVGFVPRGVAGYSKALVRVEFAERDAADTLCIAEHAFAECSKLSAIALPEGVTTISEGAFHSSGLKQVSLPESLLTLGKDAFSHCESLQSVQLGSQIQQMGDAVFSGCTALSEVKSWPATLKRIPSRTFYDCLKLLDLSAFEGVDTIGAAAFGCSQEEIELVGKQVASITLPNSLTMVEEDAFKRHLGIGSVSFGPNLRRVEREAFAYMQYLTDFQFASVDSLEYVGANAFHSVKWWYRQEEEHPNDGIYLGPVLLGLSGNVTNLVVREGTRCIAPEACKRAGLRTLELPTSLRIIGANAFQECSSLKQVDVPEGVEEIENSAFSYASGIKEITLPSTLKRIGLGALNFQPNTYQAGASYVLYCAAMTPPKLPEEGRLFSKNMGSYQHRVPEEAIDLYAAAPCWGDYDLIGEAEQTVTVVDAVREYGDENPSFSCEELLDGEPEFVCEADKQSSVGIYPIIVNRGTLKGYRLNFQNGTLTIDPATLTASVGDYSREQGEDNPVFTILYSGWKNGEDECVLAEKPTAFCEATAESAPGDYPVTLSGGEAQNYAFDYVNGTLTVTESSGIAELLADGKERRIYTISGRRIPQPQRGVNIIVTSDGRRVKVMSK